MKFWATVLFIYCFVEICYKVQCFETILRISQFSWAFFLEVTYMIVVILQAGTYRFLNMCHLSVMLEYLRADCSIWVA
jgi:hypothetical protein